MSAPRYEIRDSLTSERGYRFSSLDRARRELSHAVPRARFYLYDRTNRGRVCDGCPNTTEAIGRRHCDECETNGG